MDITGEVAERLELALGATAAAAEVVMRYYQSDSLTVELKADESPVTVADREAEELLRATISGRFPDDGILGEEFGDQPGTSGFRWIVDPIDGTKSFVHGVPLFGILAGIEHNGEMAAGVARFPATREVVYASIGTGCWWQRGDNEPVRAHVTETADLSDALFSTTTITGWGAAGQRDALDRMCAATRLARGWGDCYGHILVATGRADVMIDPQLNPWDCAALVPIMHEAGGAFVDWNGDTTIHSGNGLCVNGQLKEQVLAVLAQTG